MMHQWCYMMQDKTAPTLRLAYMVMVFLFLHLQQSIKVMVVYRADYSGVQPNSAAISMSRGTARIA